MINTIPELKRLFEGTPLSGKEIIELPVLETDEWAFVVNVEVQNLELSWRTARSRLSITERWPVVSTCWCGDVEFPARIIEEDLFSRFYFLESSDKKDVSPRYLIQKSRSSNPQTFVDEMAGDWERETQEYFDEMIDYNLEHTKSGCGVAPKRKDIDLASMWNEHILDRWLLDWELAHGSDHNRQEWHLDWFEPDNACLVLLPTASSWETLAYMNWFNSSYYGAENYIALGKMWEKQFGAELVAHYGTMLQCIVSRPPADAESAWQVARQHVLAGGSTLGSNFLRDYACSLINYDRWFLHDRP